MWQDVDLTALRVVEEIEVERVGTPTPSGFTTVCSRWSLSVENVMGTCDRNGCSHSLLFPLESLA